MEERIIVRSSPDNRTKFERFRDKMKTFAIVYYPMHFLNVFRKSVKPFIKWYRYKFSVKFNKDGLNKTEIREKKIIASLTSHPGRINIVPYVIASLLNQTMKPDKIILWLGEGKFPDKKLPKIFDEVKACGVDIEFREDLKPHTKYFYAVQEYPEDIIITDDDYIYNPDVIENLYASYIKRPDCVSANRVEAIRFWPDGAMKSYSEFGWDIEPEIGEVSHRYIASGVSGVLYPPHSLHSEAFNKETFKKICPRADDLWLRIMELLNGTKVARATEKSYVPGWEAFNSQSCALWHMNVAGSGNDEQMAAVIEKYNTRQKDGKTILEILREEGAK